MATPTTLVEFATQERDAYQAAQTRVEGELADAQADLTQAAGDLAMAAGGAADLERTIAAKRAQLAATTVPADASALLAEITALMIEQRTAQAQILDLEEASSDARARATAGREVALQVAAQRSAAETALAREQAAAQLRQTWTTAVTASPLDTLQAEVSATLTSPRFTAAAGEFNDLPAKVRQTASSRYSVYGARLDAARTAVVTAEDLLTDEYGANGGLEGTVAQRRIAYDRAERALRDYVSSAADRFAFAVSLLDDVGAAELLSDAEKDDIDEAALVTAGESAADLGIARDGAQKTMDEKLAALADVTVEQRAADPDGDVTAVQEVQDAQDELDTATGDCDDAQTAFDAEKDALAAWLAIVPDRAWVKVRAFLDASAILDELSTANPAALVTDLTAAEEALAEALADAAPRRRAVLLLREAVALRSARLTAAITARDARLLSAARGDS